MRKNIIRALSKEQLYNFAIRTCSISGILKQLGLAPNGENNRKTLKEKLAEYAIDLNILSKREDLRIKQCSECRETKPLTEFNKKGSGHQSNCRLCDNARLRRHYQQNKDYYKKKAKRNKAKTVSLYKELKEGLCCTKCGESHIACLDFHHRNPEEKEFSIACMADEGYGIERIKKEMEKCDVLCANCHRKLHHP